MDASTAEPNGDAPDDIEEDAEADVPAPADAEEPELWLQPTQAKLIARPATMHLAGVDPVSMLLLYCEYRQGPLIQRGGGSAEDAKR